MNEWYQYAKSPNKSYNLPSSPHSHYKNKGWRGWHDWLNKKLKYTKKDIKNGQTKYLYEKQN